MDIAIIGRGELLFKTAKLLTENGHCIKLIITAKEAPEYKVTHSDFAELATKLGAQYIYTPKINLHEHRFAIEAAGCIDIGVSINYTSAIYQDIINLFPLGILNAHAGDLPRYRGNAPLAWAILNGESRAGLCIHKMKGGELDSGDIIEKSYHKIDLKTKIGDLFSWLESDVPNLMVSAINKLSLDPLYFLEKQSQNPQDILRCYPRHPDDAKIDWSKPAIEIIRLINASSAPFSGAFCFYLSEKIYVLDAELYEDNEIFCAVPGQICKLFNNNIIVATGLGKIIIKETSIPINNFKNIFRSVRTRFN